MAFMGNYTSLFYADVIINSVHNVNACLFILAC